MKIVDSITALFFLAYLATSAAVDTPPESYIRSGQRSEKRILQLTETSLPQAPAESSTVSSMAVNSTDETDATECLFSLAECLASSEPGEPPFEEWSSFIEGVTNDPAGVSTELLSFVQEASIMDIEYELYIIKDHLTPHQVATIAAESPAVVEKLNAIAAKLNSIIPTNGKSAKLNLFVLSGILAAIGKTFIFLSKIAKWIGSGQSKIFGHFHKILKVIFNAFHWVLKLFLHHRGQQGKLPAKKFAPILLLGLVAHAVSTVVIIVTVVALLSLVGLSNAVGPDVGPDIGQDNCDAELLACRYQQYLFETVPSLLSIAFLDEASP